MLVLSRHEAESIIIAPGTPYETRVTVTRISRDSVRLGITAARDVTVHREEVQDGITKLRKSDTS